MTSGLRLLDPTVHSVFIFICVSDSCATEQNVVAVIYCSAPISDYSLVDFLVT